MASRRAKKAPRVLSLRKWWQRVGKRRFRLRTVLGGAMLSSIVTASVLGYFLIHARGYSRGRVHHIELHPDSNLDSIVTELSQHGLLRYPELFRLYARWVGVPSHLRDGEMWFSDDMSATEVARRLSTNLGNARVRINFPEGWNRFEVARRLQSWRIVNEGEFLAATTDEGLLRALAIDSASAEGYLFPATYTFREGESGVDVVRQLVAVFHARYASVCARFPEVVAEREAEGFESFDIVRMASVVEEEAGVVDEQRTIAGVFYNRLRSQTFLPHARLQSDPTVKYGCEVDPTLASCDRATITRAMLEDVNNPYNTYRHAGLPPTAISNPGETSLMAALNPATHNYLYFVARGHARHAFASTLEEHNRNVAAYRQRTSAN